MNPTELQNIKANIFPLAWPAVGNPDTFDWHKSKGVIDTWQDNSSQALCVDVFGTLSQLTGKDRIFEKIALRLGIPGDGAWNVKLEWTEHDNPLQEKRCSQIDAVAISPASIILFECKFTEGSGSCSQVIPLNDGPHKGQHQCNGNYELQVNPVNGKKNFCALTGKIIKYWDYIPKLFTLDSQQPYQPCPFRDKWYQVMRNLVLAAALKEKTGKATAVVLVYVDHQQSKTNQWLQSGDWNEFQKCFRAGSIPFEQWSYASLLRLAQDADPGNKLWDDLASWVGRKCSEVFRSI